MHGDCGNHAGMLHPHCATHDHQMRAGVRLSDYSNVSCLAFRVGNRQWLVAFSVAIWRIQLLHAIGILVKAALSDTCDSVAINAARDTCMNTHLLSDYCIYVLKASRDLEGILTGETPCGPFTERKQWTTGEQLLNDAKQQHCLMPIFFSPADKDWLISYIAILTDITFEPDSGEGVTTYAFRDLKSLNQKYAKSSLIKKSTDTPLSDRYIRSYAVCKTPVFAVDLLDEWVSFPDEIMENDDENVMVSEWAHKVVTINRYERSKLARDICLAVSGYRCTVCKFDFEERYGDLGKQFIHVHHLTPLSTRETGARTDPKKDLIPLCPNCHAMIHRATPPLTVEELRARLKNLPCT
jgi:hypothetical protein